MYIMITSCLKGKDNIHIKYRQVQETIASNEAQMSLVFEVSFVRTFDSRSRDSSVHSEMNILANGRHPSYMGESKKRFQKGRDDKLKFKANVNQLLPTEMASGQ